MADAVHGRTLGVKLCEALGLDPREVVSITVHASHDEPVMVTVQRVVLKPADLDSAFTDYELVEKT